MHNTTGHSHHALSIMACSLTMLLIATASLQAQDQPTNPTKAPTQLTETLTETLPLTDLMDLNELLALRASMGGGISKQVEGVIPGADAEQQVYDAMKGLFAKKKIPAPTSPLAAQANRPDRSNGVAADDARVALRDAAKKLEELAAGLEQVQFYDKADELRETAAKFWLQARDLN